VTAAGVPVDRLISRPDVGEPGQGGGGLVAVDQADAAEPELTPDEVAELWRQYRKRKCDHCLGAHARACPRVRRLEFHENGRLRSVSFWPRGEWSDEGILWPEDIPGEPPEA
jgi:hypothetical protein